MYLHSHKKKCDYIFEFYHWGIGDIKSLGTVELTDFKGNKYHQRNFYCMYFLELILYRQHVVTNLGHLQAFYHKGLEYVIAISVLSNWHLNFIFNVAHVAYHFYYKETVKFDTTFKIIKYKMFYLYYIFLDIFPIWWRVIYRLCGSLIVLAITV